jgi:hypothetical protein
LERFGGSRLLFGVDGAALGTRAAPWHNHAMICTTDCGEYCQAAGAIAKRVTAILFPERIMMRLLSGVPLMEKHELSAIDFKLIDDAFKALLQSNPDPVTADKIKDLRNMFHDAYTGWIEIDEAA